MDSINQNLDFPTLEMTLEDLGTGLDLDSGLSIKSSKSSESTDNQ